MKFFKRTEKPIYPNLQRDFDPYNLDQPMYWVSPDPDDFITLENCFTGQLIFGGTGFGKTTGSGQTIARALLRWGDRKTRFGGLVGCAKVDEAKRWIQEYCREWGR